MQPSPVQGYALSTPHIPLAQRWQQLKPAILELYLHRNIPLPQIISIMKEAPYYFHAVENSYKYYFTQWGVSKNVLIPTEIKDAALTALGKRTRGGYSTPEVVYKKDDGQMLPIDKKRIKRHIKTIEAKGTKSDPIQLGNNVFLHWNLPYRAARSSTRTQQFSPLDPTPDFLSIASPNAHRLTSSRNASSLNNAPTPTMLAVRAMKLDERTQLFISARHADLFRQLESAEKKLLTTYLYQFWLFSFRTAKYWGYGPTLWTAELLEFDRFKDKERLLHSSPDTPMTNAGTPRPIDTPRSMGTPRDSRDLATKPSQLCKWTIHAAIRTRYEGEEEDQEIDEDKERTEINDEDDLPSWPAGHRQTFEQKLQAALETNSFSTLDPKDLPMVVAKVAKAARSSPRELLHESFAFSLVARNEKVFWSLLSRASRFSFVGTGIYPLHLLASYLDGSKTCCNLFDAALNHLAEESRIDKIYVNNRGHTVLDNLFISILKGHTNCLPDVVDDNFSKMKRFVGEEVDICGRWDADSSCVRELFAEGHSSIPIEWKHMFCHTSVQTICHCIGRIFGPIFAPDINTPSGLFIKTCQCCGKKLQLGPLHSLVLTAVHLAESGCPGENLFGMLACLVCLLANGADPTQTSLISLPALMRRDTATTCSHEDIDPFQLAQRVPESLVMGWSEAATLGWKVLCAMLQYAKDERRPRQGPTTNPRTRKEGDTRDVFMGFTETDPFEISDDEADDDDSEDDGSGYSEDEVDEALCSHFKSETTNFYGRSKVIGALWAAIQTELLTYRRLTNEETRGYPRTSTCRPCWRGSEMEAYSQSSSLRRI